MAFGTIRPAMTSTTLTRVIASARVWGCGVTEAAAMSVAMAANEKIVKLRTRISGHSRSGGV
jgi:hypothetical protein